MSCSSEISTAATTRLRTLQSSLATSTCASPSSSPLSPHTSGEQREMAKRTEIEPLLASPSHEPQYTSDKLNSDSSTMAGSVHISLEDEQASTSRSMNNGPEDSLLSYHEDDRALLIADKPASIRTQLEHVYLFNFLALLFVFINMTLNLTVLAIIHERIPMREPHLPDISFDLLPDSRRLLDVAEYFIVIQMASITLLLFFHKHRSIILRRICIIMGVIYFFRAICMASTQLPLASRNYQCSPQLKNSSETANVSSFEFVEIIASRVFYMSIGMGLSINGHHSYCGDYIFSGHTVILVLAYLTFQEYLLPSRRRTLLWKIFQLSQFSMTFISVICIVIARGHYFIDIILAYFVTTRIFWIYHSMCNSSPSVLRSSTNYFNRLWWWPVFVYFENVKYSVPYTAKSEESNQVQRKFEWPLPWPKSFVRRKHRNQFMA